jgi:hypothetical protein
MEDVIFLAWYGAGSKGPGENAVAGDNKDWI